MLKKWLQNLSKDSGSRGQAAGRGREVLLALVVMLAGCVQYDESTYITDDQGIVHHSKYYTLDKRGRSYFPKQIKADGQKTFVFDPKATAWAAYDAEGNRVMTGAASGGKDLCEEDGKPCRTVTGTFRVYNKRGINCTSGEYPVETHGGTKMPYCMYFFQGYTIHAGYEVPEYNASHGCIRVFSSAAKWLNEQFITIGTKVVVLSYVDENGDGGWLQPRTSLQAQAKTQATHASTATPKQYAQGHSRLKLRPRGRGYA